MRQNIPVIQLMPGMKIVALDIGWSNSPKWTSPFVLNSGEDLALLLQHCKIVAIETNQAANESPTQAAAKAPTASQLSAAPAVTKNQIQKPETSQIEGLS